MQPFGHMPLQPSCCLFVILVSVQAAAKRFKITGTGKVVLRHPGKQHINEKKSSKRLSQLGKPHMVGANVTCQSLCIMLTLHQHHLLSWPVPHLTVLGEKMCTRNNFSTSHNKEFFACHRSWHVHTLRFFQDVYHASVWSSRFCNSQLVICRRVTQSCLE